MSDDKFHATMAIEVDFTREQALAIFGYAPQDDDLPTDAELARWVQEGVAEDGPEWLLRERIEVWDLHTRVERPTASDQPSGDAS